MREAPLLVLGLGNLPLGDDALGLRLLARLSGSSCEAQHADYVDGGTQGIALLGYIEKRRAVLLLDAVELGAPAGTVHVIRGEQLARFAPHGQARHVKAGRWACWPRHDCWAMSRRR